MLCRPDRVKVLRSAAQRPILCISPPALPLTGWLRGRGFVHMRERADFLPNSCRDLCAGCRKKVNRLPPEDGTSAEHHRGQNAVAGKGWALVTIPRSHLRAQQVDLSNPDPGFSSWRYVHMRAVARISCLLLSGVRAGFLRKGN
jgi:hypothetical protein